MSSVLRYGVDSSIEFELPPEVLVAHCDAPRGKCLESPAEAVRAALAEPLGFPPLARVVMPDDKVVLAVALDVPQAEQVVAAAVNYLGDHGVLAANITVLRAGKSGAMGQPNGAGGDNGSKRPGGGGSPLTEETHDPNDRNKLSYLAATVKGRPIYLNRALCDADVVVPIGCLHSAQALGYYGVHGGLYPAMSDIATLKRYRSPSLVDPQTEQRARAQHEVDTVGRLVGVQFTIQVVPGPGDELLHVLAGDVAKVAARGDALRQRAWTCQVPARASLVVAAIPGRWAQQTWDSVGRVLALARRLVHDGGSIALCTDLAVEPRAALKCLAGISEPHLALPEIGKQRGHDTLGAIELVRALEIARVYLLSRLEDSLVDDLNVAPVSEPADIVRLALRHDSCILLAGAQHAEVSLSEP